MLKLPDNLTPTDFLGTYWQKQALFMRGALDTLRPSISRNELAWLATLEDVESRLVFVDEDRNKRRRYRVETGPFTEDFLQCLPKRNWTLLVHDVEKHLPAMRALFAEIPFVPDWRIDDLMVSFAAPGGGVGPHKDHYDVFLCQGIGTRRWRITSEILEDDPGASDEISLLQEFDADDDYSASNGDVLYLPPGVAHWGTAVRACMTYSIGMRAPRHRELAAVLDLANDPSQPPLLGFFSDGDLGSSESTPGYIDPRAAMRVVTQLELRNQDHRAASQALGQVATQLKDWLRPDEINQERADEILAFASARDRLVVHGMSKVAFDDQNVYVNGETAGQWPESLAHREWLVELCRNRCAAMPGPYTAEPGELLLSMARLCAFDSSELS